MTNDREGSAPLTPAQIFDKLPEFFRADQAQGVTGVFQFDLAGAGGGRWQVAVEGGACQVTAEGERVPTVNFAMSAADFVGLVARTLDAQMAFMTGRIKVQGDMFMALRFAQIFSFGA